MDCCATGRAHAAAAGGDGPAGDRDDKVLYAHLGGAPAINGYGYAFRNG